MDKRTIYEVWEKMNEMDEVETGDTDADWWALKTWLGKQYKEALDVPATK